MLIELKAVTAHGEFLAKAQRVALIEKRMVQNLMTLARNQSLIEEKKPESQRAG